MKTHPNLIAAAISLTLALAGAAHAGPKAALPAQLPPYAPDRPLPVPNIVKKTLSNGLEVWVLPRDGMPRVDYVLAMRNAGYAADGADASGFAAQLAGLLNEGTAQRDSKAIAEAAQGYGGSIGASANNDGINLYGDALVSNAAPMLALLAEIARTPAFPDGEVKLAQANAQQALKAAEAQPSFKASRALLAATYGDHPYARTQPTESMIAAITPQKLRAEHARRFRPDRALLIITGRVSPEDGFKLAERSFGDWKAEGAAIADTAPAPREAKPSFVLIQRDGSVQSTLRLGRPAIPITDPDYVPMQLASTVLGGGFSSRVNHNLGVHMGYPFGACAGLLPARAGGRVQGGADVRNEVTGAALKEFFHEFERLGKEPVPAQELEDTKRYIAGGYMISNQQQGSVAATLANQWLMGLPSDFLGQYVPRIRAVDAAQVQAIAKKYFVPAEQSIVVVGDGKAVAEQLKAYGEFVAPAK